jgi:hypothetical protein
MWGGNEEQVPGCTVYYGVEKTAVYGGGVDRILGCIALMYHVEDVLWCISYGPLTFDLFNL